jgi:hypothetical protein
VILYEDIPYGLGKSLPKFKKLLITKEIDQKIDLILKYKTQLKGFLFLTGCKEIEELKRKLKKHHRIKNNFFERFIRLNK